MASAATPKRMVSSVFITLASPHRATVTQQQHAIQTHNAPSIDKPHAVMRVNPGDSIHALSQRHKKEAPSPESCGSTDSVGWTRVEAVARSSDIRPAAAHSGLSQGEQQKDKDVRGTEELLPPPTSLPSPQGTALPEEPAPPLPPSPQELSYHSSSPGQSPLYSKQLETRTPSSGVDQDEQSQGIHKNGQEMSQEGRDVCGFCRKTVAPAEAAIEALNRTYHDGCFQCRYCHTPLAGKQYYNKAGIPLCEDCYQASLELCWACGEVIKDHVIRALERAYHPACFTCATCKQEIGEQRFAQGEVGEVYCLQDYYRKYAPQCNACKQLIIPKEDGTDSYTVECLGRSFHEDCYRCEICAIQLSPEPNDHGCHPLDGRMLCKSCHLSVVSGQL
ncbi:filamin-binding LIM protein 1 isoform X2 [Myripristis murdjan]|uniref:Filamin binding LIM protein 1 n=1 Tax=Myripristis murdjan TaxID=586833 RepID=A0A667YD99_9TELE|nr:filamin-binding LIM protein 1 isoform X2 [Myripristis murdjan]